jgi:hypothetical protein
MANMSIIVATREPNALNSAWSMNHPRIHHDGPVGTTERSQRGMTGWPQRARYLRQMRTAARLGTAATPNSGQAGGLSKA